MLFRDWLQELRIDWLGSRKPRRAKTLKAKQGSLWAEVLEQRVMLSSAPVSCDDSYTVEQDGWLETTSPGVLENDYDDDFDTLTAVLDTAASDGTVTLYSDGSFSYEPDPEFIGTDWFTYHSNDGFLDGNIATVTIDVTDYGTGGENTAPVATDDSYTLEENGMLDEFSPGVLWND